MPAHPAGRPLPAGRIDCEQSTASSSRQRQRGDGRRDEGPRPPLGRRRRGARRGRTPQRVATNRDHTRRRARLRGRAAGVVAVAAAVGAEAKRGRELRVRERARRDGARRERRRAALARGSDRDRGRRCRPTLGHDFMDAGGGGDSRQPAETRRAHSPPASSSSSRHPSGPRSPSQPSKSSAERKGSTSALRVEALRKCGLGGMERARAAT